LVPSDAFVTVVSLKFDSNLWTQLQQIGGLPANSNFWLDTYKTIGHATVLLERHHGGLVCQNSWGKEAPFPKIDLGILTNMTQEFSSFIVYSPI